MLNEIKYIAHISQDSPELFYNALREQINKCQSLGYHAEVQYKTTMQLNGIALFCAVILGRAKETR